MLSSHDARIYKYMQENFNGKCKFNKGKKCDGVCNNCPFDYYREIEKVKAEGKYVLNHSFYQCIRIQDDNDYEGAILARQESFYD